MARPQKIGLDYFPLDVQLDEKFELKKSALKIPFFDSLIAALVNMMMASLCLDL